MDLLSSTYMDEFLTLVMLQLIAVASPGPDFAMVVQNSLLHSRRIGLYTATGIAFGIIFHVTLTLFGVGLIVSQSWWLFNGVKVMACGYLFYLAYASMKARKDKSLSHELASPLAKNITTKKAFYTGVLTNVLNPKAILFFLSVFTVVVSPKTPTLLLISYGFVVFFITLAWFVFIALCFSNAKVHAWFNEKGKWIHQITAFVFMGLAFKLLHDLLMN